MTKLSSKGQVIVPKNRRVAHGWEPGQAFLVVDAEDGVFLMALSPRVH